MEENKEVKTVTLPRKTKSCDVCGTEIAKNAKSCPKCGAKNKKPIYKRWWFIAVVIFFVLAIIVSTMDNTDSKLPTSTSTDGKAAQEPSEVEGTDYFKHAMYKVGTDIPAGAYAIIGSGYAQLSSSSDGTLESIITNENYNNLWYIELKDGEYFEFNNGKAYPIDKAPSVDTSSGKLPEGMYKVGKDIPAGEYKIYAASSGYIEVTKGCRGSLEDIVTNDNFSGDKYITVSDGQYLKLHGCELNVK